MALVVALHEDEALFRVDAAGEQESECLARLGAALLRVDVDCHGVQVGDEIVAVVFFLQILPALDGAEVVAEREDARRLDAGKDDFLLHFFCHDGFLLWMRQGHGIQKVPDSTRTLSGTNFSMYVKKFAVPPCFTAVPCNSRERQDSPALSRRPRVAAY